MLPIPAQAGIHGVGFDAVSDHSFGESQKNQKDFGGWRNSYYECALREFFLWKSYKEQHRLQSVTWLIEQLALGRTKELKQSPSPKPPKGIEKLRRYRRQLQMSQTPRTGQRVCCDAQRWAEEEAVGVGEGGVEEEAENRARVGSERGGIKGNAANFAVNTNNAAVANGKSCLCARDRHTATDAAFEIRTKTETCKHFPLHR